MILDTLVNAARYEALHPGLRAGFDFLRKTNVGALAPGKLMIDGARLYAVIVRGPGSGRAQAKLETHRKYIDIQFAIAGTDVFGWRPLEACRETAQAYDPATDAALYADAPWAWSDLPPASFAVFFPWDAHAPMAAEGELHKVIVKVAMVWE